MYHDPIPNKSFPLNLSSEDAHARVLDPTTSKSFVFFFDAALCTPSMDPNTKQQRLAPDDRAYVRSPAINRLVRDIVADVHGKPLYIQRGACLHKRQEACGNSAAAIQETYSDANVFGFVPTKDKAVSQVKGAIQFDHARSLHPVEVFVDSITRVAGKDKTDKEGNKIDGLDETMGDTPGIYYGLFRLTGTYSAITAEGRNITPEMLGMYLDGLFRGWEHARSSLRSGVTMLGGYVYDHGHRAFGGMNLQDCVGDVRVTLREGLDAPRSTEDYTFEIVSDVLPRQMTRVFVSGSRMQQERLLGITYTSEMSA